MTQVYTVGTRNGNVICPVTNLTKRTKQLNLTVTSTMAGWATTRAVAVFTADSNGIWRIDFNIKGTMDANSGPYNCTIAGISFNTAMGNSSISSCCFGGTNAPPKATYTEAGSGGISCYPLAGASNNTSFSVWGGMELDAEPTWASIGAYTAATVMENAAGMDVYVPSTCPTISTALVTGAGTGTGGFVSGTYTTPTGCRWLRVRMVGGGGGGCGSGTNEGAAAGAGGNTTFNTTLLVAGGGALGAFNIAAGGAGGTNSSTAGPTIIQSIVGGKGSSGSYTPVGTGFSLSGGNGGSNTLGASGAGALGNEAGLTAAANSGGGGGGAGIYGNAAAVYTGSGGGSGGYLEAIISAPAATYTYSVGAIGTAGGAGGSGYAGGAGALGGIWIEEHYL